MVSVVGFIILIFAVFLSMPWWMAKLTHWDAKHARWSVFNGYSKVPRIWGAGARGSVIVMPLFLCAALLNYGGSNNDLVFILIGVGGVLFSLAQSPLGTALKQNLGSCRKYLGSALVIEALLILGFHYLPGGNALAGFLSLVVAVAIGVMWLYYSDEGSYHFILDNE